MGQGEPFVGSLPLPVSLALPINLRASIEDHAMRRCLDCPRTIARGSRCARCQRAYRPRNVQAAWAAAVVARDGVCVDCGGTDALQADHVVPLARGGGWTLDNGATRCQRCHARRTTAQRRGKV